MSYVKHLYRCRTDEISFDVHDQSSHYVDNLDDWKVKHEDLHVLQ